MISFLVLENVHSASLSAFLVLTNSSTRVSVTRWKHGDGFLFLKYKAFYKPAWWDVTLLPVFLHPFSPLTSLFGAEYRSR